MGLTLTLTSCVSYLFVNQCVIYDDYNLLPLNIIGGDTTNKFVYTCGQFKIYCDADNLIENGLQPTLHYLDSASQIYTNVKFIAFRKKYMDQKMYIDKHLKSGKEIDFNNFPNKTISYFDKKGTKRVYTNSMSDFGIALELGFVTIINTKTQNKLENVKLIKTECYEGKTTIILKTVHNQPIIKYKYEYKI